MGGEGVEEGRGGACGVWGWCLEGGEGVVRVGLGMRWRCGVSVCGVRVEAGWGGKVCGLRLGVACCVGLLLWREVGLGGVGWGGVGGVVWRGGMVLGRMCGMCGWVVYVGVAVQGVEGVCVGWVFAWG